MRFASLLCVFFGSVLARSALATEDPETARVRLELEQQLLQATAPALPPQLLVYFEGVTDPTYSLVEADFRLDGQALPAPLVSELERPGIHLLWGAAVGAGPHVLTSKVIYRDGNARQGLFYSTGFIWKLVSQFNFAAQRGLELKVVAKAQVVPDASDISLKLKVGHTVAARMLSPIDDTPISEPVAKTPSLSAPPLPAQASAGNLAVVKLTVDGNQKPLAATVSIYGETEQKVATAEGSKAPARVELPAGHYRVDVGANGFLSQTREIQPSPQAEMAVAFHLSPEPQKRVVIVREKKINILQQIHFAERKATILPDSNGLLNQVVDAIVQYNVKRLRIEGHTDNRGDKRVNLKLSQNRAKAVAEYLQKSGIEASRLETAGFGDSKPAAPNFTARGRELNRRVEFIILAGQ